MRSQLKELFGDYEVTRQPVSRDLPSGLYYTYIINKYGMKPGLFDVKLSPRVGVHLVSIGILIEDSGNLETDEIHYIYNDNISNSSLYEFYTYHSIIGGVIVS